MSSLNYSFQNSGVSDLSGDPNRLASWLFSWLLNHHHWKSAGGWRAVTWQRAYEYGLARFSGSATAINVHGHRTLLNFGHSYPLFARTYRNWNNPLIEIVSQMHRLKGQPLSVIDVGAGIGDTVLLLEANCAQAVSHYLCVEGDPHFARHLHANTTQLGRVRVANTMLAAIVSDVRSLVRSHPGTATATGADQRHAVTLDLLIEQLGELSFDVLKIDVDGFDGEVLAGSHRLLEREKPAVIFEWHPIGCDAAGNSWRRHFEILEAHNYTRFIWFNKFGEFSHFSTPPNGDLASLAQLAARRVHDPDWHYDVVALHATSEISDLEVAELTFARNRRSWF